jgi:hypothetical protein
MKSLLTLLMAFLLLGSPIVRAQETAIPLPKAIYEITRHLSEKKPEWKHRLITPITESAEASASNWEYGSRVVRVTVFSPSITRGEMARAIREFAAKEGALRLEGIGDEGYADGAGGRSVVFMLRNLTIAISTNMPDPLEGKKLSHEFARIISDALRSAAT